MLQINITIEAGAGFAKLQRLLEDLTPFYRGIAESLKAASDRAFSEQVDPVTGASWEALSPVTIKRRRGGAKHILIVNNNLQDSVQPGYSSDGAWISTNMVYAKTQFFGAKKGDFGYSIGGHFRRVTPIPWGDIPARPFMGLGDEEEQDILDMIANRIKSEI